MRIDTGENTFECSVCFKSFFPKCNLNLHLRNNVNELPFDCLKCGPRFAEVRGKQSHGIRFEWRRFLCVNMCLPNVPWIGTCKQNILKKCHSNAQIPKKIIYLKNESIDIRLDTRRFAVYANVNSICFWNSIFLWIHMRVYHAGVTCVLHINPTY